MRHLVLLGLSLLLGVGSAQTPKTFSNPVVSMGSPDPWIQYYGGNYYLTYTGSRYIVMKKAKSLADLETAPETIVWSGDAIDRCCQMFAPEMHLLDGPNGKRWYLYFSPNDGKTDLTHAMYVLESAGTDPLGPYSFKAKLLDHTYTQGKVEGQLNYYAIDGTVLKNPRDKGLYLVWSDGFLWIARMSNPWTVSSPPTLVSRPTYAWEKTNNWGVNEGPEALIRGDTLHLIYSGNSCFQDSYALGRLSVPLSSDLLDAKVWEKAKAASSKPVFEQSPAVNVYGPGHNGFFQSPDGKEDWIIYHANPFPGLGCGDSRNARAQRFTWNADGTPNFGVPADPSVPLPVPSGEAR